MTRLELAASTTPTDVVCPLVRFTCFHTVSAPRHLLPELFSSTVSACSVFVDWIDSTIKHIDPLHRAQHFTPRKPGSPYSRPNIERLIWLDGQGLIHPKIRKSVIDLIRAPYVFPEDISNAIQADLAAWENYQSFPEGYKRIRIAYIDAARKRPVEFEKRLHNFIIKTRAGKMIPGFGGIAKYYGSK